MKNLQISFKCVKRLYRLDKYVVAEDLDTLFSYKTKIMFLKNCSVNETDIF